MHSILVMDKINSINQYESYLVTKYRVKSVSSQKREDRSDE